MVPRNRTPVNGTRTTRLHGHLYRYTVGERHYLRPPLLQEGLLLLPYFDACLASPVGWLGVSGSYVADNSSVAGYYRDTHRAARSRTLKKKTAEVMSAYDTLLGFRYVQDWSARNLCAGRVSSISTLHVGPDPPDPRPNPNSTL